MFKLKIYLYYPQNLIAHLTAWYTRSRYSHASLVIDNIVYEAVQPRVRARHVDDHEKHADIYYIELDATKEEILEWIYDKCFIKKNYEWASLQDNPIDFYIGKPYDLCSLIFGFLGKGTRESRISKNRWFCSEFPAALCEHFGNPLFDETEPFLIPPAWIPRSTKTKKWESISTKQQEK